jgi:hypothetical protein
LRVSKGEEIEPHIDQRSGRESREGWLFHSMTGGFKDETTKIESQGERVADGHGSGSVGEAKGGRAFELPASLSCIAALGIRLSAHAQVPGIRIDLGIPREPNGTIWQGQSSAERKSKARSVIGIGKRAGGSGYLGLGTRDIRVRLVQALAMTDPFGGVTLIIMTIASHAIAMRTERSPVLIVPTLKAGERQIISIGVSQANGAQSVEILMYVLKDLIEPLTRITEELTDLEGGETPAQILQAWNGQQMIVAIGRSAGTRQRPDQEEPVVDDVEGFGLVSEVMFPARDAGFLVFSGYIRIGPARLIGARVIVIPNSG